MLDSLALQCHDTAPISRFSHRLRNARNQRKGMTRWRAFEEVGDVIDAGRVGQATQPQGGSICADHRLDGRPVAVGRHKGRQLPRRWRHRDWMRQGGRACRLLGLAQIVLPLLQGLHISTHMVLRLPCQGVQYTVVGECHSHVWLSLTQYRRCAGQLCTRNLVASHLCKASNLAGVGQTCIMLAFVERNSSMYLSPISFLWRFRASF